MSCAIYPGGRDGVGESVREWRRLTYSFSTCRYARGVSVTTQIMLREVWLREGRARGPIWSERELDMFERS